MGLSLAEIKKNNIYRNANSPELGGIITNLTIKIRFTPLCFPNLLKKPSFEINYLLLFLFISAENSA